MNKYIDAERLKAEIERRRLQNRYIDTDGYEQELFEIIDSLQQEQQEEPDKGLDVTDFCKPIDPGIAQCVADHWWELLGDKEPDKSLDEAAEEWAENEAYGKSDAEFEMAYKGFIAGAKQQKEQDTRDMFMSDNRHFNKVYELGKKDMKQQMLKDAVEGYVNYYEDGGGKLMAEAQVGCPYHIGDKVRIIIVKEEEK